jgi:hypothetical protein
MKRSLLAGACMAFLIAILTSSPALAQLGARVPNWSAPSGSGRSHALGIESDIGPGGTAFVPVTPCRIVDTRGPAGTFGAPALAPGSPRNFPLLSGPCAGLPGAVLGYSLNITATNTAGTGFFKVFPQGGTAPVVSTLNYVAGQTVANAAIVPAGTGGGITVSAGVAGADLLVDINGYFVGGGGLDPLNPGEFVGFRGSYPSGPVVFGWNTDATGFGVWGQGAGIGVYGNSLAPSFSVSLAGVWGTSTNAIGTFGNSTNSNGMWAQSTNYDALAAFGGRDGTYSQGARFGVFGVSVGTANGLAGVRGISGSGAVVETFSYFSAGVRGEGKTQIGVLGLTNSASGAGVLGASFDSTSPSTPVAEGLLGYSGNAVYSFGNFVATGSKSFIEPHETDASKVVRYVCLEGPESGTYFRGSAQIVHGRAVISVPEDFRMVTDSEGLTVQLTPIGAPARMYVVSEDLGEVVVSADRDVKFHYLINGVRKAFKNFQPIEDGTDFMPRSSSEKMPGYLTTEARRRLIANGTYNPDGTVNMETAQRVGWTRIWQQQAEEARAQAESALERVPSSARQ